MTEQMPGGDLRAGPRHERLVRQARLGELSWPSPAEPVGLAIARVGRAEVGKAGPGGHRAA